MQEVLAHTTKAFLRSLQCQIAIMLTLRPTWCLGGDEMLSECRELNKLLKLTVWALAQSWWM
eukprot:3718306-Amphidinium_carterae.1